MSRLEFESAALERLYSLHMTLEAGIHVVLGTELDGTIELIDLAAGARPPRRGSVKVQGAPPFSSPRIRRDIAALFATESMTPEGSLAQALARALAVRGDADTGRLLEEYGLGSWRDRRVGSLSARERRTLALLVALSHERAGLIALFEPLAIAAELDVPSVVRRLEQRARGGACVLVATASTEHAISLGGSWLLLERGVLRSISHRAEPPELGAASTHALSIRTAEARRLVQALSDRPDVAGLTFDERNGSRELLVLGPNPEALAETVVLTARGLGVSIDAIALVVPPLAALVAAKDGWARGAYERSYAAGYAAPPRAGGGVYGT